MPSPRWPMRAMVRRSVTPRSEQEFAIPLPALDWRRHNTQHIPAERGRTIGNVIARGGMYSRVPHDAFLEILPAGLELRLDQCDELRRTAHHPAKRRQHQSERNETDIDGDEVRSLAELCRIERTDVGLLKRHQRRITTRARVRRAGTVGRHAPRRDRRVRLGAAHKQAALDENDVSALARDLYARRITPIFSRPSASKTFATMPFVSRPALAYIAFGES